MDKTLAQKALAAATTAVLASLPLLLDPQALFAFSGTEAASFLDIPVGGRPAALGGAYSSEAADAYAPIYNPGGLGLLQTTELAGMHISYLDSINYEYATFVHPFTAGNSLGISAQYLNPGQSTGRDAGGALTSDFGGHYGAYSLSYGHHIGNEFGLGATAKFIESKIETESAHAYAFDFGGMYRPTKELSFAAVVTNLGTKLKFLDQKDSLPTTVRIGASYSWQRWMLIADGAHENTGLFSGRAGLEWTPLDLVSLRVGYKSDTTRELSAMAGFTTGIGIHVLGQEFDYAWVPVGDLGDTHYFSLVLRFSHSDKEKRNLVYLPAGSEEGTSGTSGYYEPPMLNLEGAPAPAQASQTSEQRQ